VTTAFAGDPQAHFTVSPQVEVRFELAPAAAPPPAPAKEKSR